MGVPGGLRRGSSAGRPMQTESSSPDMPTTVFPSRGWENPDDTAGRSPEGDSGACEQVHIPGTATGAVSSEQHDTGVGSDCAEQHAWSLPPSPIRQPGAPPNPTECGRMKAATKSPMKK